MVTDTQTTGNQITVGAKQLYNQKREALGQELAAKTLPQNPNVTYGAVLSPRELEALALVYSPELKAEAVNIYGLDSVNNLINAVDVNKRIKPYDRPPLPFEISEYFPDYDRRMGIYNSDEAVRIREQEKQGIFTPYNPLDQRELDMRQQPYLIGLADGSWDSSPAARVQRLAALGFDATKQAEYKFSDVEAGRRFAFDRALNPRIMTTADYEHLAKKYGMEGAEFMYMNPSNPADGIAIKPNPEADWQVINSPLITSEDTFNFLLQEFPALALDAGLVIYATRKGGRLRMSGPTLRSKGKKILGLSALSGAGAAGGDFLRMTLGVALGSHDRDFDDIFKESGMIGALSFGGTALISTGAQVIPKVWGMITGKDVPDTFYEQIDDLYKAARADEIGGPAGGINYGVEGVAELNRQIEELARRMGVDLKKYNPTLSGQTQTVEAADLETMFLKYADDPKLREAFIQIKLGNDEVINNLITKVAGSTSDVTAADLSKGLSGLAQENYDKIVRDMEDMITEVRGALPQGGTVDSAGNALMKDVIDPNASSPMFQRTTSRLNQMRNNYMTNANDLMEQALANPLYQDLVTGAGYLKRPTQAWINSTRKKSENLFQAFGDKDAKNVLKELLGTNGGETLRRLTAKNKAGKFAGPDELGFNLRELHDARVTLNDFASRYADKYPKAARLARDLERGFERQIDELINSAVRQQLTKEGINPTPKAVMRRRAESGFGEDLRTAWTTQKEAIKDSYSQIIRELLKKNPEDVARYILSTNSKNASSNTRLEPLLRILKAENGDELRQIQLGVARYLEAELLEDTSKSSLQRATAFRQFARENKGTLRAIYGDDVPIFQPKRFIDEVITPLERMNDDLLFLTNRFGVSNLGRPDERMFNIVENILSAGRTQKESGILLDDIQFFSNIVKRNPALQEGMADVTKRYILQQILKPTGRRGAQYSYDPFALDDLLYKGFGPENMVGPQLTFDNFIKPLLGKEADEYVKNLKLLNEMMLKEAGQAPTPQVQRKVMGDEYKQGANIEDARFLQRMLIAPLSIVGRRVNALLRNQERRSRTHIGYMVLDQKYADAYRKFYEGKISYDQLTNIMSSYGIVIYQDLGSEDELYNEYERALQIPEDREEVNFPMIQDNKIIDKVISGGIY